MSAPETFDVAVAGGALRVGRWPGRSGDVPTVLAAHGITANHVSFTAVADALGGDVALVAPDLRGRGRSNGITGPFGITAHADDVVRVLDHVGVDRAAVVGHSMGGWVAAYAAVRYPDRVAAVVLVDGGLALPGTVGADVDVDAVLQAVLGPAIARLSMTFPSRDAYRQFWRQHPAVGGAAWTSLMEAYVDYDVVGAEPELRSSVSIDAVRGDATQQLTVPEVRDAVEAAPCPTHLLCAPRGLLDGDPLYPATALDAMRPRWRTVVDEMVVPDVNHYTIVIGPGAAAVADVVRRTVAAVG